MKNTVRFFALTLSVFYLVLNSPVLAQEEERNIYVITTWKTVIPEGGNAAERDSLLSEWVTDVQNRNDKILSTKVLRHYYGSDSQDWVIIDEYKTWSDIEEAVKIGRELSKEKWPNDEERAEFFRKVMKYFTTHSDEIYRELPRFNK
jgi:hypothetical protein